MKKVTLTLEQQTKLARLKKAPKVFYYEGADLPSYDSIPLVAVVGTRKPSPYGKLVTEQIVTALVRQGIGIISGLAIGIDALAHSAALAANGRTIAVLPSGLAAVYPASHQPLAMKIITQNGTLLSECASDHTPRKVEFLERNRIIAALADLVIIPEAAGQSGSLNTAQHAAAMGVPIAVVPGNITSPMSEGTNYLLARGGAHAIRNAQDVLALLGIAQNGEQIALDLIGDTPEQTLLLQKIALGSQNMEQLQQETKLTIQELQLALSMLEVQGRIKGNELGEWTVIQ